MFIVEQKNRKFIDEIELFQTESPDCNPLFATELMRLRPYNLRSSKSYDTYLKFQVIGIFSSVIEFYIMATIKLKNSEFAFRIIECQLNIYENTLAYHTTDGGEIIDSTESDIKLINMAFVITPYLYERTDQYIIDKISHSINKQEKLSYINPWDNNISEYKSIIDLQIIND
jgi:hypothetical protein